MILVTGGTGLVGSHLLYQLSLENESIKAIYRKESNLQTVKKVFSYYSKDFEHLFSKIEWVEADIMDVESLKIAFENISKVFHSAALISFNPKDYQEMRRINIEGTANISNFCIANNVDKLCFVSSIAAVGRSLDGESNNEDNEWNIEESNYGYAITKHGAEMEIWRASLEGVPVVIVNPGVILGAGFWERGSGSVFDKIYNGFKFYTEGVTGYVSVQDVVNSMKLLMNSDIQNERFILVSENLSFKKVFSNIAIALKKEAPSIRTTHFMSSIVWRVEWLRAFLTRKAPLLTKQSAKSILQKRFYSSKKIEDLLNFKFEPISKSIKNISELYLKEKNSNQ